MGLSCSWLFNNSKGQHTGEKKKPKPIPSLPISSVWQEASQPRQRISAQECLISNSTKKEKGGGGRKPYARPSFPMAEFKQFKRASRGRQGLTAPCAGDQQAEGPIGGRCCPLCTLVPGSPSPLWLPTPALGHSRAPAPAHPLPPVTAHVIPPNTAHVVGIADTGEPKGARPPHPTEQGSVPSCSAPTLPRFI